MAKKLPAIHIKDRIAGAIERGRYGRRDYFAVLSEVFPIAEYPKAWRYSSNGGPPGCVMALGRAIRRYGFGDRSVEGTRYLFLPSNSKGE